MSRSAVIVNPAAGGGRTGDLWPRLREALRREGLAFDEALTGGPGEATALAAEAARTAPLVVAVGGDGTLNEVVNGLAGDRDRPPRAVLGAVLTGRGRDAARTLGLPRDPLTAVTRVAHGTEGALDLGLAVWPGGRRLFVNAAGLGFDAQVAACARSLPGRGTVPYLKAVARCLRAYQPLALGLSEDARSPVGLSVAGIVVANGPCFGGGMRIAPGADPADGALDLVVLGALARWELALWLPTLYWGGHLRHPRVRLARVRRVMVEGRGPLRLQADGEPCDGAAGGDWRVEITVLPRALRVRR